LLLVVFELWIFNHVLYDVAIKSARYVVFLKCYVGLSRCQWQVSWFCSIHAGKVYYKARC